MRKLMFRPGLYTGELRWDVKDKTPLEYNEKYEENMKIKRYLDIFDKDIIESVEDSLENSQGRIFGAAIIDPKGKLLVTSGNSIYKTGNILMHAEIQAMTLAQELYRDSIGLENHILLSTHEPCPLCLSGAYWAGIKEIYYIFSYEETSSLFDMHGDIDMIDKLFGRKHAINDNGLIDINKIEQPEVYVNHVKDRFKKLYDKYFDGGIPRWEK